jgi:EmrB/QacA subfamily drug resistance transporter
MPATPGEHSQKASLMTNSNFGGTSHGLPPSSPETRSGLASTTYADAEAAATQPRLGSAPLHSSGPGGRSRWWTLAVLAVAQFMVVLDVTIVNVALPKIQTDLGFTPEDLQWIVSAYTLVFGGFLLLGGRAADLLGRRSVFMTGMVLFAGSSLVAGLATTQGQIVGARAVQGLGGALLSPAALSILTVTFAHGRERNLAMGVWGGLAGLGGSMGAIIGGTLVDNVGWSWIFYVNVPVAALVVALTPVFVRESRAARTGRGTFDVAGAVTVTAAILALVLGVIRAEPLGWSSPEVVVLLAASPVLLAAFLAIEARSDQPLVPLSLFRSRGLSTSGAMLALSGGAFLGMFFMSAIFMQRVRGLSALTTGVQLLPLGLAVVASAVLVSRIVHRTGTRLLQVAGALVSVAGLALLMQVDAETGYWSGIVPGLILFGLGLMALNVPAQITAVVDVAHDVAGAAAGVVSASFQVGGAVGIAIIVTSSTARTGSAIVHGLSRADALVEGFHRGLLIAAAYSAINITVGLLAPNHKPTAEQIAESSVA